MIQQHLFGIEIAVHKLRQLLCNQPIEKPGFADRHRKATRDEIERARNPKDFKPGDKVFDIYCGDPYLVVIADKRGMALFKDLESGKLQDFNAYNNRHFIPLGTHLAMPRAQRTSTVAWLPD